MALRLPLVLGTNGLLRQAQAADTIDLTTGTGVSLSTGVTGTLTNTQLANAVFNRQLAMMMLRV